MTFFVDTQSIYSFAEILIMFVSVIGVGWKAGAWTRGVRDSIQELKVEVMKLSKVVDENNKIATNHISTIEKEIVAINGKIT